MLNFKIYQNIVLKTIIDHQIDIITLSDYKRSQESGLNEERMLKYFTLGAWALYSPL
jgi:hypothetical protein